MSKEFPIPPHLLILSNWKHGIIELTTRLDLTRSKKHKTSRKRNAHFEHQSYTYAHPHLQWTNPHYTCYYGETL